MNAVEIEEAVSALAEQPFDGAEFPFAFLQAFGNKATTIKRLRSGESNNSDLGGVLQRGNIHIKICAEGEAVATLAALKASPATARARAKFVLATDGIEFHAEDLSSGDVVVCGYRDFPEHFGFFLPLAGITTVRQIRESAFDIKATGRLNRLYVELLKENPEWGAADRRPEMNHFMARLIFCFFAEDTDILNSPGLFTDTIERMSAADSSNTHEVIGEVFRAMNTDAKARRDADIPRWAASFPYVNGGLFSQSTDVPRFSRIARSYLLHIGKLDWKKINPDIFGSMIQAVADDEERGEQYLLIKSPPASGKSRALMFVALDKLHNQDIAQAIVVVPERTIGASFEDARLSEFGFWADWTVRPKWNLCNAPGGDGGKVNSVKTFLDGDDRVLVCTHATFRFAMDRFGAESFDGRLIAVDEFHHVSANPDNRLGEHIGQLMARDRTHIVAMTGSYFRGDAEPVLAPQDEARFETVTYTYYEQLNGYEHLKRLDIGYYFYSGNYADSILKVLDPGEKTIVHIPNVNSRESTKDKIREVEHILEELGDWQGADSETGFQLVAAPGGRVLRIADLVDDEPARRDRVAAALRDPSQKDNRDHVDIIVALGMAKEGFDWIWCDHALTVGYRSSLTEIVQIIGRATRDAPGKARARFTNLIAEPDASEEAVAEAVNDTLKAIAASLLMEQVLAPRFNFTPKTSESRPVEGVDYGQDGYDENKCNVGFEEETGQFHVEIKGLAMPASKEAERVCREDLNEVIAAFAQDRVAVERGMFDEEIVPEELTQLRMGKIVKERYPELSEEDREAVRQHAVAALNLARKGKEAAVEEDEGSPDEGRGGNTALIDGVRKFAMDVRDLDIDLIDRINPFQEAYAILAKAMSEESLKQIAAVITAKKVQLTPEEARDLARRALRFKQERGRLPSITSPDPWERRMAEGVAFLARMKAQAADG